MADLENLIEKVTKAQVENLTHVRLHGHAKPRSPSGYWCRKNGLVEWVFDRPDKNDLDRKIIGEQLTEAGRALLSALSQQEAK